MQTVEPPINNNNSPAPAAVVPPVSTATAMTLHTDESTPTPVKDKTSALPFKKAGVIILFFLFFVTVIVYFFYIRPRSNLVHDSKKLTSAISPLKASIKSVNSSLNDMFDTITNQKQSETNQNTLLRLNVDSFVSNLKTITRGVGEVAGASTLVQAINSPAHEFAVAMQTSYDVLRKGNTFGSVKTDVLGSTSPLESERVNRLRQLKEYAKSGADSASSADLSLTELQNSMSAMLDKNLETDLYTVLKTLGNTNLKTQSYLVQAQKTTKYYERIAEIQIKLDPTLTSYYALINSVAQSASPELYIDRIKEIEITINEIDKEIQAIPEYDIPEGMSNLHKDNLKVGEILVQNVKDVRQSLEQSSYVAFLTSIVNVSQKLEPIATRAISTELSFWQDNKYLRDGESILKDYDTNAEELQGIIKKNRLPYLTES